MARKQKKNNVRKTLSGRIAKKKGISPAPYKRKLFIDFLFATWPLICLYNFSSTVVFDSREFLEFIKKRKVHTNVKKVLPFISHKKKRKTFFFFDPNMVISHCSLSYDVDFARMVAIHISEMNKGLLPNKRIIAVTHLLRNFSLLKFFLSFINFFLLNILLEPHTSKSARSKFL